MNFRKIILTSAFLILLLFVFGNIKYSHFHKKTDFCSDSSYCHFKKRVLIVREQMWAAYKKSANKSKILDSCRTLLETYIQDSIFSYWQNTPWDFYGTTQKPQCGKIACGYFVTTVLNDLGFKIPRIKWAEVASETFIRSFCKDRVKTFYAAQEKEIEQHYKKSKAHIFIAGLDNHVGFLIKTGDSFFFMHSSFYHPDVGVMKENAAGNNPFFHSQYRAIGELLYDEMVLDWLKGTAWK